MANVYLVLAAHFVGDFICQSDWMAVNKSKDWKALSAHVAAYSAVLGGVVGLANLERLAGSWLVFVLVNAALHFITDAVTSRITSRLWFVPMVALTHDEMDRYSWTSTHRCKVLATRHWFFVAIGADQLIHAVTLIATAQVLL